MKTAIQEAAELYEANGLSLARDLEYYLKHGYVFCAPDRLLLAQEIKREDEGRSWTAPGTGDTWFVQLAVGKDCVSWFIQQAPYSRKWVAWFRQFKNPGGKLHFYDFEKLKRKLTHNI